MIKVTQSKPNTFTLTCNVSKHVVNIVVGDVIAFEAFPEWLEDTVRFNTLIVSHDLLEINFQPDDDVSVIKSTFTTLIASLTEVEESPNYYLVQRGKFYLQFKETMLKSCDMDYMGSSEFEFGALPTTMGRFLSTKDELCWVILKLKKGTKWDTLYAIVRKSQVNKLHKELWDFEKGFADTKEYVTLNDRRSFLFGIDEDMEFIVAVDAKPLRKLKWLAPKSFEVLTLNRWIPAGAELNEYWIGL